MPSERRTSKAVVPPFLRRRLIVMILVCLATGPLVIAVSKLGKRQLPNWVYAIAIAVPGSASGVVAWWFGVSLEKTQRRARGLGGKMCWGCGYSLEGIAADGACPECGRAYTHSELRDRWDVKSS
ncbi:hypothetical protein PHYC_02536 [Phycisphaerales bacterium]|nr:hypothetical protein PHYC_02536 [Phycisphaerales bacterium]